MFKVTAKIWNPTTGRADKPVEYIARNFDEARNWIKCNQSYIREARTEEMQS